MEKQIPKDRLRIRIIFKGSETPMLNISIYSVYVNMSKVWYKLQILKTKRQQWEEWHYFISLQVSLMNG